MQCEFCFNNYFTVLTWIVNLLPSPLFAAAFGLKICLNFIMQTNVYFDSLCNKHDLERLLHHGVFFNYVVTFIRNVSELIILKYRKELIFLQNKDYVTNLLKHRIQLLNIVYVWIVFNHNSLPWVYFIAYLRKIKVHICK